MNGFDLETLLPRAIQWAAEQEARILEEGVALNPQQTADAIAIGVQRPEKVRLSAVARIPAPSDPVLAKAAYQTGLLSAGTDGLTLGYGIFLRADHAAYRRLVCHELCHVRQYEERGGIEGFLKEYLSQVISFRYWDAPLEAQAREQEFTFPPEY